MPMQEIWVQSRRRKDPLEEEMATHSRILAWRIPMERGAWWATDHGVARSRTQLNNEAPQHSCLGASDSFLHSFVSSVCAPSFFSSATQESRTLYYPLVV